MPKCDHIVAILTQADGKKLIMRQSRYEAGGVCETFQNEMLDFCAECEAEIDWKVIHDKIGI